MLQATIGRDLHWTEHIRLVALAVANAACEELTSRGFWRSEFEITACLSLHRSNILQALVFGAWHFHGIPSGWLGVALAAVYGWIMGALADYFADTVGPGLWVPILVHSMTDYYIFACLARKQNLNATP